MTEKLQRIANQDTPPEVNVPGTWPALIVWAVGRFGIGVVFAAMLVYVYMDLRDSTRANIEVIRETSQAIAELTHSIQHTNIRIDRLDRSMRDRGYDTRMRETDQE